MKVVLSIGPFFVFFEIVLFPTLAIFALSVTVL